MTNNTPGDIPVGTDDVQLMLRLGVPVALIRVLLKEADLPISEDLMRSNKPVSQGLSKAERAVLLSGGARGLDEDAAAMRAEGRLMALNHLNECRALVEKSYELGVVAEFLGISPETTKACVSGEARDLYAFQITYDGPWLFPQWQFYESDRIPNLHHLLLEVGESANPLVFSRFMLMESVDLEADEVPLSPRDWLIRGFEPEPVLMLVRDL